MNKKKTIAVISIALLVLIADQLLKIWVKTGFVLYESFPIFGDWFRLTFVENKGMAFGMELFGGQVGKFILTAVRLIASGLIIYMLYKMIKANISWGVLICSTLVFAGAFGNIIDSVFYGQFFSQSFAGTAAMPAIAFPEGGGYAPLFQGEVVDMFDFDLFMIHFPDWFPFWGGEYLRFFPAIFNFADSAITVGLFVLIIFYWKKLAAFLADTFEKGKKESTAPKA